jgi:hypothetical protein
MTDKWIAYCWCRDCTGEDYMGCNDGEPWTLGPFPTREEAEAAGEAESNKAGPYEYEVRTA